MFRKPILPMAVSAPVPLSVAQWNFAVKKYRAMERKVFRVINDIGCMVPDRQFLRFNEGGKKWEGCQLTVAFFARCFLPNQNDICNELSWLAQLQITPICHRHNCVRPDHLVIEEQHRRGKRIYCGEKGYCNCGSIVKCLRTQPSEIKPDYSVLFKTKAEVEALLEAAPEFVIHSEDRFVNKNRNTKKVKANEPKRRSTTQRMLT